jgi:hypothetical protein
MQTELGFENENFITNPDSPEYKKFMSEPAGWRRPIGNDRESETAGQHAREATRCSSQARTNCSTIVTLEITKLEVETHTLISRKLESVQRSLSPEERVKRAQSSAGAPQQ